MKTNSFFLLSSLLLFFVTSCTSPPPPPDLAQVTQELQALEDAYAVASNKNDAEGILAYYAEDAVSLPDGRPPITGKAAILADLKAEMAKDTSNSTIRFEVIKVWADGNMAVEHGKGYTTYPDGKVTTGKYISVFEKRDGKYLCVRDIWNEDTKASTDDDHDEGEEGHDHDED